MNMSLNQIIKVLGTHKESLSKEFGIVSIGIYGSLAEAKAQNDSDIDLFYQLAEGESLGLKELDELEEKIKTILGREDVDIVNFRFMNPIIRYRAQKHLVHA